MRAFFLMLVVIRLRLCHRQAARRDRLEAPERQNQQHDDDEHQERRAHRSSPFPITPIPGLRCAWAGSGFARPAVSRESSDGARASQRWRMATMAKRVLAPIAARERSAAIVPVVFALAHGSGATVRLLRIFPVPHRVIGPRGETVAYADQEMARLTAEGLDDLRRLEVELDGIPVESVDRFGDS